MHFVSRKVRGFPEAHGHGHPLHSVICLKCIYHLRQNVLDKVTFKIYSVYIIFVVSIVFALINNMIQTYVNSNNINLNTVYCTVDSRFTCVKKNKIYFDKNLLIKILPSTMHINICHALLFTIDIVRIPTRSLPIYAYIWYLLEI